ncbi:hypothetical protein [Streptosporangium lutulentum]|uniref:Uncharacterized protein n=1 Tax=Streptosporangium lutulentum TaxID=1461250 RepID=A0ABT9Q5Q5_9ACTN|nr:hypothetical protein [Streptosporangium lutulentum]MDP9841698.1 hypothetical protein [Streptosporangium lutulentum]
MSAPTSSGAETQATTETPDTTDPAHEHTDERGHVYIGHHRRRLDQDLTP